MKNKILGILLLIFGLYLIVSSGKSIIYLWNTGKRVDVAEEKLFKAQKKNQELKKRLAEIRSQEYIEKIARDELNLGREGESVIILPEDIQQQAESKPQIKSTSNWQKWYQLFF